MTVPVDSLAWLDLAGYALTRTAGFGDRSPPAREAFAPWYRANSPGWRGERPAEGVERAVGAIAGSYALAAVTATAEALLFCSDSGWLLKPDWSSTTLMRWRIPSGTLHAAAAARAAVPVGHGPLRGDVDAGLNRLLHSGGVVDGHVHVGAIVPYDVLFHLVLSRLLETPHRIVASRTAEALGDELFADSDGIAYLPGHLLSVAALLMALIVPYTDDFESSTGSFEDHLSSVGVDPVVARVLRERTSLWTLLASDEPATTSGARWKSVERYLPRDVPAPPAPSSDLHLHVLERKRRMFAAAFASGDSVLGAAIEDLLRCEAVLHFALTQGPRSGLGEFLVSSRRLSGLRKVMGTKHTVVAEGLRYLTRSVNLTGIELRTAEQPWPGERLTEADLARSLGAQLDGYLAHAAACDADPPVATWPLCLIRGSPSTMRRAPGRTVSGGYTIRFRVDELWDAVETMSRLLTTTPRARWLVPGLDVAGDEGGMPSWVFAILFNEFRNRMRLSGLAPEPVPAVSLRVHAGESYSTPLQGLRRVDEAVRRVMLPPVTPRIGHGLVLARPTWELRPQAWDEAFDDLTWAWTTLATHGSDSEANHLAGVLEPLVQEAGAQKYGLNCAEASAAAFAAAYEARFAARTLTRLGVLQESVSLRQGARWRGEVADMPAGGSDRLVAEYLTRNDLENPLIEPLVDPVRMRQLYDALRPVVLRELLARGAVVEACPTSNLVIGGIDGYGQHPLLDLLREGIGVTINTDDPGLFGVNIFDEFGAIWPGLGALHADAGARRDCCDALRARGVEVFDGCADGAATVRLAKEVQATWRERRLLPPAGRSVQAATASFDVGAVVQDAPSQA